MTVTAQTEQPYAWIRQIPGDLFKLDEKPLLGSPPPLDWTAFAAKITSSLGLKEFSLKASEWQWRSKDELMTGLGNELKGCNLAVAPLPGSAWWVMAAQDLKIIMRILLAQDLSGDGEEVDADFLSAFYRFLTIEALNAWEKAFPDKRIIPSPAVEESLPAEHCLSMDVAIHIGSKVLQGRLFLSEKLRAAWKQHFLSPPAAVNLNSPLANSLDVCVHLEAGRVNLKPSEWKKLKTGDFLFLDNCSLDPDEDKGRVMLTMQGFPFFRARLKQGNLKILEHPLYHEVDTLMDETTNHDENDEDMFSEEEFADENSAPDSPEPSQENSIGDQDLADEDFDFDEISDSEIEKSEKPAEGSIVENSVVEESIVEPSKKVPASSLSQPAQESAPTSIEEVPLPVIIEIGRIQMSIKKLLELQPGNMLELNIHPETGVDLVVNGKRVARGELLRVGEALGVRILELS